jgi:hypothetical protein
MECRDERQRDPKYVGSQKREDHADGVSRRKDIAKMREEIVKANEGGNRRKRIMLEAEIHEMRLKLRAPGNT